MDMAKNAISQKKEGKAPSPSGIVVGMIQEAGGMATSMICDLAAANIHDRLGAEFHCLSVQG